MVDIIELSEFIKSGGLDKAYKWAVERGDTEGFIVDLVTRDQMGVRHEDGTGKKLADIGGEYSVLTQVVKGLGPREVNLFNEGDYWESFSVKYTKGGFIVSSNPIKDDGTNLEDRYGTNLEQTNHENTEKASDFIEEKLWKRVDSML